MDEHSILPLHQSHVQQLSVVARHYITLALLHNGCLELGYLDSVWFMHTSCVLELGYLDSVWFMYTSCVLVCVRF